MPLRRVIAERKMIFNSLTLTYAINLNMVKAEDPLTPTRKSIRRLGSSKLTCGFRAGSWTDPSVQLSQMERRAGIEPASLAWKAKVLPLHKRRVGRFI